MRNTLEQWGAASKFFHWITIILIVVAIIQACVAASLPLGMEKLSLLTWHKSVGFLILGISTLRVTWRWMNPIPVEPGNLRSIEKKLASVAHFFLYFFMFVIPLTGWLMSSARGFPVSVFGLFQMPDLISKNNEAFILYRNLHFSSLIGLGAVVTLHVAGALKHHFVLKNQVLIRMLPFR